MKSQKLAELIGQLQTQVVRTRRLKVASAAMEEEDLARKCWLEGYASGLESSILRLQRSVVARRKTPSQPRTVVNADKPKTQ